MQVLVCICSPLLLILHTMLCLQYKRLFLLRFYCCQSCCSNALLGYCIRLCSLLCHILFYFFPCITHPASHHLSHTVFPHTAAFHHRKHKRTFPLNNESPHVASSVTKPREATLGV